MYDIKPCQGSIPSTTPQTQPTYINSLQWFDNLSGCTEKRAVHKTALFLCGCPATIFTFPPNLPLKRESCGKCTTCSITASILYQWSALALLTAVRVNLCYFLCPGPSGNQPLRTRSRCCITSKMLQKEEKNTTPSIVDHIRWLTITEAIPKSTPAIANNIQLLIPT